MTLVDADSVDVSNLHRQVIHKEATAGQLKVQSAIAASRLLSQVPACVAALWSSLSLLPCSHGSQLWRQGHWRITDVH